MTRCLLFFVFTFIITVQSLFSQSERSLVNEGVELYKAKNYTESEIKFRKGIEKNPDSFVSNFNVGTSYFKQGKYEDALKSFQNSLSKAKENDEKFSAYYNMGNTLLKDKKYKESIEQYKNALKINPSDADAKYNLSYALKQLQQQQNQNDQKQNKQDQNKDQNKDQNQDQNKDQNKDKQDQNKDQNKNDQQNQDKNDQQNKQDQQKNAPPPKISKADAERMLNAIKNNEQDLQNKLKKKVGVRVKTDKDW